MASRDSELLAELAEALNQIRARKLATQEQITLLTGVDQPTISRAKKRKLVRFSEKARILLDYARRTLEDSDTGNSFEALARKFYAAGGSERELESTVELAISLITRRFQSSEAREDPEIAGPDSGAHD